ncbi:MAG TPA: tetratricopeptide repeat protein [Armatimonadota bacterium]|nr:tetratricopeptide repeat protein [Armatimonadota bacterium]
MYNLRAVPFGIYVDEDGRLVKPPHGISSGDADTLAELDAWIGGEEIRVEGGGGGRDQSDPVVREADLRFTLGSHLLTQDRQDEAIVQWRKALELDPDNWIIHKQIWAVEHPEAFYEGSVDYGWQKQELAKESGGG